MRMRGTGRDEVRDMVALLAKAVVVLAVVIGLGVGSVTGMPITRAYADDAVADTESSAGSVRLADQEVTASDAIPENPGTKLPSQVSETIPDDATVVSEDLAVTNDGEVKDLETGKPVTDPAIVGTQDAPADPLAKTSGKSFIPVDASDVKDAVSANGGDANASTADQSTADQSNATQSSESSSSDGVAHVTPASFTGNEYGAHWGTYNGSRAFFDYQNNLFAQQAKGVIDVSEWQGDIDWAAARADGVQGAIIRIGFGAGNRIDTKAQRNINECKRLGIPFGVYLYSYTEVADSGDWEGDDTVSKLRALGVGPADLGYPVFYDLEDWTGTWSGHRAPTDPNVWNGAVNKWYAKLQAAGYRNLGVYSYTQFLKTSLNNANIHAKVRWIASYGARTGFDIASNDRGWQYTANGRINGVNGTADLNAFGVRDYQAPVNVRAMSVVSVPDGDYYINAMIKDSSSVEIPGGSTASGARTQLNSWNKSGAQQFKFSKQSDGSYVIANKQSGLVLDVRNGSAGNGSIVQQYAANGSAAQRWFIRDSGAGYYLQSALGNWVLDINGASTANGASVTLYAPNGTEAQRFVLASVDVNVPTGKTVKIESVAKSGLVMAVAGESAYDRARIQLAKTDGSYAKLYTLSEVGNGVYQIVNQNSGKVLEVAGGSASSGAAIQQYASNGTKAQHWSLLGTGSGTYAFINNASGKAIDIPSGNAVTGANLQSYTYNGTAAQRWKVSEVKLGTLTRLAGDTRYGTMSSVVSKAFGGKSTYVVVASGDGFADALSAAALAGGLKAPIVLTTSSTLSQEAADKIKRLEATKAVIVGSSVAVSDETERAIKDLGLSVERADGANRYETNRKVYQLGKRLGVVWSSTAIVASGDGFADALSISSYAYAKAAPIFLASAQDGLPEATVDTLRTDKKAFSAAIVTGGTIVVPAEVESIQLKRLGITSTRLQGATRYETSAKIAEYALNHGLSMNNAVFASGEGFADALAGSALAGRNGAVLMLVSGQVSPAITVAASHRDGVSNAYVLGGASVLDGATSNAVAAALMLKREG